MIKTSFPEVILIESKTNLGFAKANNLGVTVATGEYICLLNPDTVVSLSIFKNLLNSMYTLPNVGIIGPRLIDGAGEYLPESKRNIPSPLASLRRLFGIKLSHVKSYYANHISVESIGDVDVLVGAFMMMHRKHYNWIGGFDEIFFMYGEDIDLSYRFKKGGFQNYYIGNLIAIHYKGESIDPDPKFTRLFYNAMRLFYKKHFKSTFFLDRLISFAIRIVAISEDVKLCNKLSEVLKKEITIVAGLVKEDLGDTNIEIIFDNNFVNFHQIINYMQDLQKENSTFKIRPRDCSYLLGSNFNDEKGETIVFN